MMQAHQQQALPMDLPSYSALIKENVKGDHDGESPPAYQSSQYTIVHSLPILIPNGSFQLVANHSLPRKRRDHHLKASMFLAVLYTVSASWLSLLCSIPAIVYSLKARAAEARHDKGSMVKYRRKSFICNLLSLFGGAVSVLLVSGACAVLLSMTQY
uniref:Uncharacterized protein n=1 Tax=Amphimedon queenslandica TaxID=400682 RepID=A0A1X7VV36_AMPQE